ncbi:SGNH/GDSL hydrolase family protein [Chitinophaga niabensis]|uniref:Lysophospholipase L1 n=1 Tax=Chitinophaga niabensis TaxID=536979 RepID=A0A1N6DM49_9BACT|nr:SGNH/GDSL hydrolase family protein [Chitinophaga niabensis]SIN71816.1 Lysophospholipase L1 [Chitinophaga niabensis]
MKINTWLALGDSYTIGEGVPLHENFPYQALQLLRNRGLLFHAPEIIAKTGWTSDELIAHMQQVRLQQEYDRVSILIGVNNQYRGMDVKDFETTLEWLAAKALQFTNGHAERVVVISIPDWGVTPFAQDRDASAIHDAIDRFNAVNQKLSREKGFHYIDITTDYRSTGMLQESVVEDMLHPSGKVYKEWAQKVAEVFYIEK